MKELIVYAYFLSVLCYCALFAMAEGDIVTKQCTKTDTIQAARRIEVIRKEHNDEWRNLPHRQQDDTFFQPK